MFSSLWSSTRSAGWSPGSEYVPTVAPAVSSSTSELLAKLATHKCPELESKTMRSGKLPTE